MNNNVKILSRYLSYFGECSLISIELLKCPEYEDDSSIKLLYEYPQINNLNNKVENIHYKGFLFATRKAINKQFITVKDLYEIMLPNNIERILLSNRSIYSPDISISIEDRDLYRIIKSYKSVAMNCLLPKNLTLFVEYE